MRRRVLDFGNHGNPTQHRHETPPPPVGRTRGKARKAPSVADLCKLDDLANPHVGEDHEGAVDVPRCAARTVGGLWMKCR